MEELDSYHVDQDSEASSDDGDEYASITRAIAIQHVSSAITSVLLSEDQQTFLPGDKKLGLNLTVHH